VVNKEGLGSVQMPDSAVAWHNYIRIEAEPLKSAIPHIPIHIG
jgi:hypothetical protein